MYCQHCGHELQRVADEIEHEPAAEVEQIVNADVEIARINADKEIQLAKINAKVTENVIEVEQAVELAAAEAKADALEEAMQPDPPDASVAPQVTILSEPDAGDGSEDTLALPAASGSAPESPGDHEEGKPKRPSGYGNSGWFGAR